MLLCITPLKMLLFVALIATAYGWDKSELAMDLQSPALQSKLFNDWLQTEHLNYPPEQKGRRFRIFRGSLKEVVKINNEQSDWESTINFMSAMTEEEKQQYYGLNVTAFPVGEWNEDPGQESKGLQAGSVDWRSRGAVATVRNQGRCGSCWAFAGIAAVEGRYKITAGALKRFSEQEILDCTYGYGKGCKGGWYWDAFDRSIARYNHLALSSAYPYTARVGSCRARSTANGMVAARCTGAYKIRRGDDNALATALNSGPVSMAFEIKGGFNSYKSGVLSINYCGNTCHHAMAVVGYTSSYWDIKNSWGSGWGDRGFVKFSRRIRNMCGISNWAAYPKLTKTGNDNSGDDNSNDNGGGSCSDSKSDCPTWAGKGFCRHTYVDYMNQHCKKSCKKCSGGDSRCSGGLSYCNGKCQHAHFCHGQ